MSANQVDYPIETMARVLGVSKAGYYAWAGRRPSLRCLADAALLKRIRTVRLGSHETYGAPRVRADLREQGERHSRKRIARPMRQVSLVGASRRRGGPITTRRDREARGARSRRPQLRGGRPEPALGGGHTYVPTASVGKAFDNAMAESFFTTIECELLARRRFRSQAEARMACFSYIEGFYNPLQRHSALGYRSPIVYET